MPFLTLGEAAKVSGKHKSTLSDAIKSGRLSASRNDKGEYQIDPAELFRLYEPTPNPTTHDPYQTPTQQAEILEVRLESAAKEVRRLEDQLADLKAERDHWRQQATYLLSHVKTETESAPEEGKGRLYAKLFGRGRKQGA